MIRSVLTSNGLCVRRCGKRILDLGYISLCSIIGSACIKVGSLVISIFDNFLQIFLGIRVLQSCFRRKSGKMHLDVTLDDHVFRYKNFYVRPFGTNFGHKIVPEGCIHRTKWPKT